VKALELLAATVASDETEVQTEPVKKVRPQA